MKAIELIILNLEEVRRRSLILWAGIPTEAANWRPDAEAMSIIEMIRHVLSSDYIYNIIAKNHGWEGGEFVTPWDGRPLTTIADEIAFAQPHHDAVLEDFRKYSEQELSDIIIVREDRNQRRKLGDYLLRIAYHESVHTGNILTYLRTLNIDRPNIWD
ncbi:DinB family protein [Mucilaginibacter sp.]|uniref:DinB family protein n=1 Tax=Mucilaginibacter sp. TaxID=1882438 RepID=UPI0032670531